MTNRKQKNRIPGASRTFLPIAATVLAAAALTSACAGTPPPAVTAARVERLQCDAVSDETRLAQLFNNGTILGAEPRYSPVSPTKDNAGGGMRGAKILMRPPEGMSAEQMTRILQCHSARAVLGQLDEQQVSKDPFSLPNAWVSINVKPEDGNFAVTMETDRVADNLRLAALAASFAQAHGVAASRPALE